MPYLLDANVFIEANRRYYGMEFCPAFWDWIIRQHSAGHVFSIEKVGDELIAGGDELSDWAINRGQSFFLKSDEAMFASLSAIGEWVSAPSYRPAAVSAFMEDPDYYLTAFAHAHGYTIVTHEVPSDGVRQVKIPNVCIGMKIKFVSTFEMLRLEHARFILAGS